MVVSVVNTIYVVAVTHLFGPIRPGAFSQLGTEPQSSENFIKNIFLVPV
jgi:hypothetical protein